MLLKASLVLCYTQIVFVTNQRNPNHFVIIEDELNTVLGNPEMQTLKWRFHHQLRLLSLLYLNVLVILTWNDQKKNMKTFHCCFWKWKIKKKITNMYIYIAWPEERFPATVDRSWRKFRTCCRERNKEVNGLHINEHQAIY